MFIVHAQGQRWIISICLMFSKTGTSVKDLSQVKTMQLWRRKLLVLSRVPRDSSHERKLSLYGVCVPFLCCFPNQGGMPPCPAVCSFPTQGLKLPKETIWRNSVCEEYLIIWAYLISIYRIMIASSMILVWPMLISCKVIMKWHEAISVEITLSWHIHNTYKWIIKKMSFNCTMYMLLSITQLTFSD